MKLSDYVVDFFEKQGLTDVFMLSGGGCMHLINSFGNSKKIQYWCTQHEQAAAMAAESYAKMKNGIGLTIVTSGPGATNTLTGVLDCYQDSTPVIFISGQAKRQQTIHQSGISGLRQFGVQEANIVPIVESITKMAVEVTEPDMIRFYLEKAVYVATHGRPGPVWLSIPLDVQSANVNVVNMCAFDKENADPTITSEDVEDVMDMLCRAERPVVIAGHGIRLAGACSLFSEVIERWNIPVVTPFMGIDVLSGDHLCNIGRIGTKGTRAGNFAMQNADLILSIGSRLSVSVVGHEYDMFAREAKIVIVDIDPQEHRKKTIHYDRLIIGDAKDFIYKWVNSTRVFEHSDWLQKCRNWKEKYPVVLPEYENDEKGINYYKCIDIINRYSKENMPIIADAGSAFYVTSQAIYLHRNQRYITTGGTATMGFSVPAAIGAWIADTTATVVAITGDGSFMQNLQELETMRFHNMKIKVFVMNNDGYFSIRQTQNKFFSGHYVGESSSSGISFPNIEKVANAFDIRFYQLSSISDCNAAMERILMEDGPAIVNVNITREMEIIPTNASAVRTDGMMISKPLEDMYPFLDRKQFEDEMIVQLVSEG